LLKNKVLSGHRDSKNHHPKKKTTATQADSIHFRFLRTNLIYSTSLHQYHSSDINLKPVCHRFKLIVCVF